MGYKLFFEIFSGLFVEKSEKKVKKLNQFFSNDT